MTGAGVNYASRLRQVFVRVGGVSAGLQNRGLLPLYWHLRSLRLETLMRTYQVLGNFPIMGVMMAIAGRTGNFPVRQIPRCVPRGVCAANRADRHASGTTLLNPMTVMIKAELIIFRGRSARASLI
jgi:hypothetical protein